MMALLELVNTDGFRFVLPEQLAVAVVLRCAAVRVTKPTKKPCIELTIPCIYGSRKCLLPLAHPGSKWQNVVAFATVATAIFEPCSRICLNCICCMNSHSAVILQKNSIVIVPDGAVDNAVVCEETSRRVTWGKAPPPPPAKRPPPPLSNYEFTHASGSISWLTMHHVGKVFMSQKNWAE